MPFQGLQSAGCCWDHNELSSEIPSSSFSMSEAELKTKMHDFVDHEMDLSTLAKDLMAHPSDNIEMPICIELIKREMHRKVRDMDINIEMEKTSDTMIAEEEPEIMQIIAEIGAKSAAYSTLPRSLQQHLINEAVNFIIDTNMTVLQALCEDESTYELEDISEDLKIHATREPKRAEFLEKAALQPPQLLRVIDIKATCLEGQVVLIDYWENTCVQQVGYSAISHTYGMEVYEVFDCQCASKCFTKVHPRCSNKLCVHDDDKLSDRHNRIVHDILRMCAILMAAGVLYVWHDGVCIAQHDEAEVMATIKCMGWIYANASETIIFLHYVGKPMTAIGLGDDQSPLTCRWHTRVWTLQEAALSKCRRYCVPVGTYSLYGCQSIEEFEKRIALLYKAASSEVHVVEEVKFSEMIQEMRTVFHPLLQDYMKTLLRDIVGVDRSNWFPLKPRVDFLFKARKWHYCIHSLIIQLMFTCFRFPSPHMAFIMASKRKSKHVGDYINSILALAGVKGFAAPKDIDMESSTLEFFKRQGQQGLERAVFCTNVLLESTYDEYFMEARQYTWLPFLWKPLAFLTKPYSCLEYVVLEDGRMELTGEMVCIEVRFTVKLEENMTKYSENPSDTERREVLDMVEAIRSHDILDMDLKSCNSESNLMVTFPEAPTCSMGRAMIPRYGDLRSLAVGHGCKIASGESFSAFVVLPQYLMHSSPDYWPALIVQGYLQTHVCKIACVETTQFFAECIDKIRDVNGPSTRILHKLIII